MKESFDKLSADLQAKLSDAKEFAKASINELLSVPQDLLSSLKVHLYFMLFYFIVNLNAVTPGTCTLTTHQLSYFDHYPRNFDSYW